MSDGVKRGIEQGAAGPAEAEGSRGEQWAVCRGWRDRAASAGQGAGAQAGRAMEARVPLLGRRGGTRSLTSSWVKKALVQGGQVAGSAELRRGYSGGYICSLALFLAQGLQNPQGFPEWEECLLLFIMSPFGGTRVYANEVTHGGPCFEGKAGHRPPWGRPSWD